MHTVMLNDIKVVKEMLQRQMYYYAPYMNYYTPYFIPFYSDYDWEAFKFLAPLQLPYSLPVAIYNPQPQQTVIYVPTV